MQHKFMKDEMINFRFSFIGFILAFVFLANCQFSYAAKGARGVFHSQSWEFLDYQRKQQGRFSEKLNKSLYNELEVKKQKRSSPPTRPIETSVEYNVPKYLPESKPYVRSSTPFSDLRVSKGKFLTTLVLFSTLSQLDAFLCDQKGTCYHYPPLPSVPLDIILPNKLPSQCEMCGDAVDLGYIEPGSFSGWACAITCFSEAIGFPPK